ncbi:MAG TPA: biotin/lipoyl-containing protein [Thermoplasmata archaeon]|nr:biotin/lipoyl-containing protein [Thermoplasmata archaeon]
MRLTVERNGRSEVVEVTPDLSSVEVGGRSFPVKVVTTSPTKVELEIAGERIVVENWPEHFPEPPGPVDVGGERWKLKVVAGSTPAVSVARPGRPEATVPPSIATTREPTGEGIAVVPPMPGRVIDVRVKDGDPVRKGDVLLRLEAMKMVNEVPSPADGIVRGVRVSPGANVRAKEPMLYISPAPAK